METLTAPNPTTLVTAEDLVMVTARSVAQAKAALNVAKAGWNMTEADGIKVYEATGMSTILLSDGKGGFIRVTVEGLTETRTDVDLEKLATLVTPEVLAQVTEPVVTLAKYRAAKAVGIIPPGVVALVEATKPVKPSMRVTFGAKP